ncbi:MAG TPA: hypothetical protein VGX52_17465 [Burkholderiales bacterium]|nr:hypothetical protein [Burkholderiales bacterium]
MIELAACAFGGFIAFLLGLAKQGPFRPGDRGPEILFAICSAIALICLFLVVAGNDPAYRSREAAFAAAGRILAFYAGTACAYFAYGRFRRAKPVSPNPRSLERPHMSPEYEAADRRMDEIFEAMKADALRGPPSSGDPRTIPSYTKMIDEAGEALLQASERESRAAERTVKMAGVVFLGIAVLYGLFVILTA